jgi:PAS domain S-box-containing protein
MTEGDVAIGATDYHRLFELNPHPMWVFDLETLRLLDVNDRAVSEYGYSRAELLRMTIRDLRPADDIPRLNDHLPKTRDNPHPRSTLWRHKKKDGSVVDVEIVSFRVRFQGRPAKLVMVCDLTERQQLAETVRDILDRIVGGLRNLGDASTLEDARALAKSFEKMADSELVAAIRGLIEGRALAPLTHALDSSECDALPDLSDREREVLERVARGFTNREVADELGLSIKSVEAYRARFMTKLGLRSRVDLIRYSLERGVLRRGK